METPETVARRIDELTAELADQALRHRLYVGLTARGEVKEAARFTDAPQRCEAIKTKLAELQLMIEGFKAADDYLAVARNNAETEKVRPRIAELAPQSVQFKDVELYLSRVGAQDAAERMGQGAFSSVREPDAAGRKRIKEYEDIVGELGRLQSAVNGINQGTAQILNAYPPRQRKIMRGE